MSGVHVIQRTTMPLYSWVVKATSTLRLPSNATYRANTTPGVHGAFPEFIHGFYAGNYGFDAGIMYKDEEFWLFYGPFGNTGLWKEMKISSAAQFGKTITFTTRFSTNTIILECSRSGGGSTTMSAPIIPSAYNVLKNGCKFVRELVIAINPDSDGVIRVPTGASFTITSFDKTDLEMGNGNTERLTRFNSVYVTGTFDSNTPKNTYNGTAYETDGLYVKDTGYASI